MKITRSTLLKASPYAALIAGFAGGALAISPLTTQREAAPTEQSGDPYLQLVQAQPLVRSTPSSRGEVQLSFAPVAARAGPAVVNVYASRVVRPMSRDPFFGRFSGPRVENSLGSGVIVRADGIIVTNNHVIEGAQSLKVVLSDRREFDAELVLADPRVDLAVLRINANREQLPTLAFADTQHDLQVGDLELAEYFEGTLDPAATVRALSDTALGQLADALYRYLDTERPAFGAHTWYELAAEELQNRTLSGADSAADDEAAAGQAIA